MPVETMSKRRAKKSRPSIALAGHEHVLGRVESVRTELRGRRRRATSSRYVGVYRDKDVKGRPWVAVLTANYAEFPIARFRTEREAAIAHDRAALFHRPKRMILNFPKLAPKLVPASALELSNAVGRQAKKHTLSRFFGVSWNGHSYVAQIQHQRRNIYLGSFDTEEEAAATYDEAALRLRGPDGRLNFDPDTGDELVGRRLRARR